MLLCNMVQPIKLNIILPLGGNSFESMVVGPWMGEKQNDPTPKLWPETPEPKGAQSIFISN